MTYQTVLLRILSSRLLGRFGQHRLRARTWTIDGGQAAGLRIGLPQNLDYLTGLSEVPVQKALAGHLRAGDVFYDVGANVGFFSLLAAKRVGPQGAVYAIEPVSENAAAIRMNARLNNFGNLTVFEVAADQRSGPAELFLTRWDGGSSLSREAVSPSDAVRSRTIPVTTLDELISSERLRPPTVIKIDVEGVELRALAGMKRTIGDCRPVLLYEVDDAESVGLARRWEAIDRFVAGLGYSITRVENSYPNLTWFVGHSLAVPIGGGL